MYELDTLRVLTVLTVFAGVVFYVAYTITKHSPWSVKSEMWDRWASGLGLARGYHESDAALRDRGMEELLKVKLKINKAPWPDHEGNDRTMLDLMLIGCIFSIIKDRNGSFLVTSESDTSFNAHLTKPQLKELANELLQLSES